MNRKFRLRRADSPVRHEKAWPRGAAVLGTVLSCIALLTLLPSEGHPPAVPDTPQSAADWRGQAWRAAPWALPALVAAVALVTLRRRPQQRGPGMPASVSPPPAEAWHTMPWSEFESLLREALRQRGYEASELEPPAQDSPRDLVLWRHGDKTLVRCQSWMTYRVGPERVRELADTMAAVGARTAYLLSCGYFTDAAQRLAAEQQIILLDAQVLRCWLAEARASQLLRNSSPVPKGTESGSESSAGIRYALQALARAQQTPQPHCPRCGRAMRRQAPWAAPMPWGCSAFPDCRGTRGPMDGD